MKEGINQRLFNMSMNLQRKANELVKQYPDGMPSNEFQRWQLLSDQASAMRKLWMKRVSHAA